MSTTNLSPVVAADRGRPARKPIGAGSPPRHGGRPPRCPAPVRLIHHRFGATLLASLVDLRRRRQRFHRLLLDVPTGLRVRTRAKQPSADLRRHYRRTLASATVLTAGLHLAAVSSIPELDVERLSPPPDAVMVVLEDIPETRQRRRLPPPPRPTVPIAVEMDLAPEDVTIESTDLDLDALPVDLLPPAPTAVDLGPPAEEEVLEYWAVEVPPERRRAVAPVYPEVARLAGLDGTVFCRALIDTSGAVLTASVVKGHSIFNEAALDAVVQFRFTPARQNDRAVRVWMVIPVQFRLRPSASPY